MPKIRFDHSGKDTEAAVGEWMYDVADQADSGIPFACKAGACGTCATEVLSGDENLGACSAREARTLAAHGLDPATHRLPCVADVHGDIVFGRPAKAPDSASKLALHDVEVESFRPLNQTVAEVRFYIAANSFEFRPGQYMIFHIPHPGQAIRRSYSISTPPSDRHHFEVCVRSVAGGHGSNWIHRLRPGKKIRVEGPFGDFALDENSDRDILMIATGTGMAPIKSMLMHLLDTSSSRRVRLFFGLRNESDLFYGDLLRGLGAHHPAFESHVTLSSPDPERWVGRRGRVTALVDELVTEAEARATDVYLCGSRRMIEDCSSRLTEKGMPEGRIHHENFY